MAFKKFLIWAIRSVIILLFATLIFSSITLELPDLMKGVFGDIFQYSSPEVQRKVIVELAETCSSLDYGQNVANIMQICTNKTLLDSMKQNCANYRTLSKKGVRVENEQQVKESCQQIESGEIDRACRDLKEKSSMMPDFAKIGMLCKDYKAGKLSDKEFFFNVVGSPFADKDFALPKMGFLEKYNNAVDYLNKNKLLYFAILAILVALLYLAIMDFSLFLIELGRISFSLGTLILLPYALIIAYNKFVGIDTTPILGSIFGLAQFDIKGVVSVVLLLFLRTYNSFILTLGILLFGIGVAGKVYRSALKGKK